MWNVGLFVEAVILASLEWQSYPISEVHIWGVLAEFAKLSPTQQELALEAAVHNQSVAEEA